MTKGGSIARSEGEAPLPTAAEACFEWPPYKLLAQEERAERMARLLQDTDFTHDAYCVKCRREGTFRRMVPARKPPPSVAGTNMGGIRLGIPLIQEIETTCTRCLVRYRFYFAPYRGGIAKVGQVPSMADIATADLIRFTGVLDDIDLSELRHATMLFAHNVAIGAFVYLRRIFERLLERHRKLVEASSGPIQGYQDMRIEQRVLALKSSLPGELVENRKVYAILSKGIHELEEESCLALAKLMHAAIVEILERDVYLKQQAKASAALRNAVAEAAGKLA